MSYATLSGATRVIAIIGDPIAQVKSPANVTRMLNERGHDTVVIPIQVTTQDVDAFIGGLSLAKNCDSIIVTIPHKFATYAHCKTATDRAEFLGSVNILRRNEDGSWHGEMFDGMGMLGGIASQGGDPKGKRTLLVGAGGAGTAIALALLEAGATELAIHDADTTRRDALIARLKDRFGARVKAGSADPTGFEMVVNATPMGMRPEDPYPVEVDKLSPDAFAACVITSPLVSPWIEAARAKGCRASVGVDMFGAELRLMVDFLIGEA
ncbi:shikimate dehydrogenase family protein [Pararobbsia silviterrae]|uniref:Shikimate dehydrogenase n=1 Tax=Pararobbsia silviterrae TaxID=1792498 RepID=A0A494XU09_9BURK|nr:shikimate dehydrogenase [Pararobbsia silviterrae]RKP53322.1 shikimate dehydrogenase [Pararobbsia silviterrae]